MPIILETPVDRAVSAPIRLNVFEVVEHRVLSRPEAPEGPLVLVSVRALLRETHQEERIIDDCAQMVDVVTESNVTMLGPVAYEGPALAAIMTAAGTHTAELIAGGLPAYKAIYMGIRDALYGALKADGVIPME